MKKQDWIPCHFVVDGELFDGDVIGISKPFWFTYYTCKSGKLIITLPASKVTLLEKPDNDTDKKGVRKEPKK